MGDLYVDVRTPSKGSYVYDQRVAKRKLREPIAYRSAERDQPDGLLEQGRGESSRERGTRKCEAGDLLC